MSSEDRSLENLDPESLKFVAADATFQWARTACARNLSTQMPLKLLHVSGTDFSWYFLFRVNHQRSGFQKQNGIPRTLTSSREPAGSAARIFLAPGSPSQITPPTCVFLAPSATFVPSSALRLRRQPSLLQRTLENSSAPLVASLHSTGVLERRMVRCA